MTLKKLQDKHNKTMKKRKKAADKSDWASIKYTCLSTPTIKQYQYKENPITSRAGFKVFKSTTQLKLGRET